MTDPARLQLARTRGFRLQEASLSLNGLPAVNVARPSVWGNPWIVVQAGRFRDGAAAWAGRHNWECNYPWFRSRREAAQRAVECFRGWIADPQTDKARAAAAGIPSLAGKNLACWCPPDLPCHSDVLLELARAYICEET